MEDKKLSQEREIVEIRVFLIILGIAFKNFPNYPFLPAAMTKERKIQVSTTLFVLEIVLLMAVLVLGIMWWNNPEGNFEPLVTILSVVALAFLEITRRTVFGVSVDGEEMKTNQPEEAGEEKSASISIGDNNKNIAVGKKIKQISIDPNR